MVVRTAFAVLLLLAVEIQAKNVTVGEHHVGKKCPPKLNKAAMLQRATLARSYAAAKKPDPTCKTGVVSLAGAVADRPQACCPAYCGECSDYTGCEKVRGQASENACCLSKVLDLECGGPAKPPANVCLKKCEEAVPPCIMAEGETFEMPGVTSAAEDCNEAVPEWMDKAETAVKAGKGGAESWDALEAAGTIYNLAGKGSKKTNIMAKANSTKFWPFSTSDAVADEPLPAGIKLMVHTKGDGKNFPVDGKTVAVHWSGSYTTPSTNGKAFFFDSSTREGGEGPFAFTLGRGEVVKCWDLAVKKMSVGEKATLTCPPEYGMGNQAVHQYKGAKPIPPGATLIFEIEILDVNK